MLFPEGAFSHAPPITALERLTVTLNSELLSILSHQFHWWQTTYSCLATSRFPKPLYCFTSWFHFSNLSTWLTFIYLVNVSCFLGEAPFVSRHVTLWPPVPLSPLHLHSLPFSPVSTNPVSCFKAGSCLFIRVLPVPKTTAATLGDEWMSAEAGTSF